jgi:hypothetical protein
VKYGDDTGGYKEFHDITKGRHNSKQIHSKIKEKMLSGRISIGEAFNYFFFQLAWRAFGRGIVASRLIPTVGDLSQEQVWKIAVPKILPLFGKAKKASLRLFVIFFGQFTDAEKNYLKQFADINEFLHERGHLIDMIWVGFTNTIFDGDDEIEKGLFKIFVTSIIREFRAVKRSALASIDKQATKIQMLVNHRYTEDEAAIERAELDLAGHCVEAVGQAITKANQDAIIEAGFSAVINTDNETLAPALQSRMQHNLLRLSGVKGGDVTGRPPAPPPGETHESAQAKIDAAESGRTASPDPPKRGRGRPKGSGKKPKDEKSTKKGKKADGGDDEFAAGVDGEAAKSDGED